MEISISRHRLQFIEDTLRETGQAVSSLGSPNAGYTDIKGYLSEADTVAHKVITEAIRAEFPSDPIYSEESQEGEQELYHRIGSMTWIIDPICGTTNYVRGIPFYVHSLSVLDNEGVHSAGIFNAPMKEMFLADRIQTTLNGRPVKVSDTPDLSQSIIAVNCNQSACRNGQDILLDLLRRLAPPVTRRVRIMESANLELAYVACGRLDGYINPDDKVWDIAAGTLMIASAGGFTSTFQGAIHDLSGCRGVIAGNRYLIAQIKTVLPDRVWVPPTYSG